jgi:hypothetical protein
LADEAALGPPTIATAELKNVYDSSRNRAYFFTQVCVKQVSAFTINEAETIAGTGVAAATPVCYDQVGLEVQPATYRSAVMGAAVGALAQPVQYGSGFEVVQVTSRTEQGFTPAVESTLEALAAEAAAVSSGGNTTADKSVLSKLHVSINPAYGVWSAQQGQVLSPQVSGT